MDKAVGPQVRPFARPGAEACEYIGPEGVYWSRGPLLMRSDGIDGPLAPVCRLRLGVRGLPGLSRLGRRLGRLGFYNVVPVGGGRLFYSFGRGIGWIGSGGASHIGGRTRPSRILRGAVCPCPDGSLLFGEYFDNPRREAVALYRWRPGALAVTVAHLFAPGAVRHVHGVAWDPHAGHAVVATGDVGDECRLMRFDRGRGVEDIGGGDESWRTISPQFGRDAIYYGTDAEFEANRLYRLDRATGARRALAELNGPAFYSAPVAGGWVFATAAELCPSQTSPEAVLYHLDAATERVRVLAQFAKDRWSARLFQFGILNLPAVAAPVSLLPVSGTALRGLDATFVAVAA